jgi:hypothetical protein
MKIDRFLQKSVKPVETSFTGLTKPDGSILKF